MTRIAHNEVFSVRDGELVTIASERPKSGRWIAVMARSVDFPDGDVSPTRPSDGAPVERAAILACQINADGLWQWIHLSSPTKEMLGDMLFESNAPKNQWAYASFTERGRKRES